jgi:hypothetical protein
MAVPTSELDSSVARLLVLADRLERQEPAPVPVVAAAPPPPPPLPETTPVPAPEAVVEVEDLAEDPVEDVLDAEDFAADERLDEVLAVDALAEETVDAFEEELEDEPEADEIDAHAFERDEFDPLSVLTISTVVESGPEGYLARLEQVRAEINDLAARRRRPRGRRRIEDAQREERELLDLLGFDSYLDLMLTNAGTPQSESGRENGEREGNGGGSGAVGGGASSDIGNGGSAFEPLPEPPAPAVEEPEVEAPPVFGVAAAFGIVEDGEPGPADEVVVEPDSFATPAPTIADWLASPLAPPIAASSTVDSDA